MPEPRQRPRGVLAHERLGVVEGALQRLNVLRRADVAEYHGASRLSPRKFARFLGEPVKAAENASWVMPNR